MDSTRRVWELTERDALLGAWCPACEQPFSAGQRVFIAFGQPTCHEDCELVSRPLASDRKPDDASRVFRHAGISYLHIPALDLRVSAAFYEAVFGWRLGGNADHPSFEDGTGHVIGHWVTDVPVAGEAGVIPYVYVHAVDDTLSSVLGHGGVVVRAPYAEGHLTVATFRDPAGNVIGVWQRDTH